LPQHFEKILSKLSEEITMLNPPPDPPDAVSFEEAIRLFKEWGFLVEPGPRPEEVTLILEGPDYRSYSVHPASELAPMAAVALRVRQRNGVKLRSLSTTARPSYALQATPGPIVSISMGLN
jgi:hypothetical protein